MHLEDVSEQWFGLNLSVDLQLQATLIKNNKV